MSIPKKIHYCWFGRNPMPPLAETCIASWKKFCPEFEIIQWNEDNYDLAAAPLYVRQAYEAKKWAFVTDYVRLQVVYENGGVYLDTDVELRKPLDSLLAYRAYFGFEGTEWIATGLGFGAEKGCSVLKTMMDDYQQIPFLLEDGSFDTTPCPQRNTRALMELGLKQDGSCQTLAGDIRILSCKYLCPIDPAYNIKRITPDTLSIHWYSASWYSETDFINRKTQIRKNRLHWISRLPNRFGTAVFGPERYARIRDRIKGLFKKG